MKSKIDCECSYCRQWRADQRYDRDLCLFFALCVGVMLYCLIA